MTIAAFDPKLFQLAGQCPDCQRGVKISRGVRVGAHGSIHISVGIVHGGIRNVVLHISDQGVHFFTDECLLTDALGACFGADLAQQATLYVVVLPGCTQLLA